MSHPLSDTALATDELLIAIAGGPNVPAVLGDIDGSTAMLCSVSADSDPWVTLDFIEGSTTVLLSTGGPINAALDPVEGATDMRIAFRGALSVVLDPLDGATQFLYTVNPGDPSQQPVLGAAGQLGNEPITVSVQLLGSLKMIPPVPVG